MATTGTPQNKVLSVVSNLLSYKKSEKSGNEKQVVNQVRLPNCCVVFSMLSMHTAFTHNIVTAFTLHNTGFEWCRGSARS